MIKVNFFKYFDSSSIFPVYKEFNCLDEFLEFYFKDDSLMVHYEILEGLEIITGEIKQKGINNK